MEELVVPRYKGKLYPYTPEGMAELAKDQRESWSCCAVCEDRRNVDFPCVICEHLRLEQKEPAILREDLFMPLVHPRILPPEKFHQENLLICDECWKMCS